MSLGSRRAALQLAALLLVLLLCAPDASQASAPSVVEQVLPNGLRVVVAEQPGSPAVTVDTWVRVGSRDETDELNGAAHFVEHMLFKGTRRRSAGDIARELESLGAWTNAATGYDYTHYYVVAPAQGIRRVLDIQADALMNSIFDPEEVERERAVILQELSLIEDTPARSAVFRLYQTAFTVHPYRRPVGGSPEVIRRLTRQQLVDFYRTYYGPANVAIVVAGGVSAREVMDAARRLFGNWRQPAAERRPASAEPPMTQVRRAAEERDVRVTTLAMGWIGPNVHNPDHYAVDVLVYALGRGRGARWLRVLRDQRRVVQTLSVGFPTAIDPPLFSVVASTAAADEREAEQAILEEVVRLREEGLRPEELARAKAVLEAEVRTENQTSRGLAGSLGFSVTVANLEYAQTYLQRIRAVTAEDVRRVAQRYLDPARYAIVAIRPRRSL